MKKILLTFMLALMAMFIHAATFTQGDFIYEIVNDSTCNLSGLSSAGSGKTYLKITGYTFNANTQKYCKVQKINQDAFENNQTITEVRIGPGVEIIGNYAFYNCTKLKIVSLPSTVQSLGNSVFYNCPITLINCAAETMPSFTSYTFNGLGTVTGTRSWWEGTTAGYNAARANSTITSLFSVAKNQPTAYDIATTMGGSGYTCDVFAIVTKAWSPVRQRGGECKIIYALPRSASTNPTSTLKVPFNTDLTDTSWDRYEPVEIADYAFQGTQSIKVLDLTDVPTRTFKRIGVCAFENCSSLTKVILSAQRVDNFAFNGCTNLSNVRLYGSYEDNYCVQELGKDCFKGTAVSSVYIPKGLISYEGGPFNSCPNLTQFTVSSENTVFTAYNYSLYSKNYATLYQYPSGRYTYLFNEEAHQSMTRINSYAFKGNTRISDLTIPYGVTSIGAEAFYGMSSLTRLLIPSSVSTFVYNTFQGMTGLKDFYFNIKTIPSTLTSSSCFNNIKSGCVLHVPRQCKSRYSSTSPWSTAFTGGIVEGCYDRLLTINNGSSLDYYVGYTVTSTATYSDPVAQSGSYNGQMSLTYCQTAIEGGFRGTINIPTTVSLRGKTYMVTEVEREVCRNDPRIVNISGGAAVKKIGALAFAGLTASTYGGACSIPNPVEFGDSCFSGSTFATIKLGTRLERIGQEALRGTYISQLIMPNTVNYIGSRFVAGATKLDTIKISNSITNIPYQGLAGVNARYIVLPYGVKTIGAYAFVSDQFRVGNGAAIPEIGGSNYVVIPSSVTTIDSDAFNCARHLEGIYLNCPYGVLTTVKNNWRRRMDLNASNAYDWSGHKLYVPVGQVQQYRNDPGIAAAWNENSDVGPGAFDFTNENNFVGTNYRMSVVNPTLKTAKYVYGEGNTGNAIVLSNGGTDHNTGITYTMVEIGDSAFVKHTAATHIYLDDATELMRIGNHAFRGLTALRQEVNVPASVQEIGQYAFYGCTNLPSVFINRSSSTTSIGTYMFSTSQQSILYVPLNRMYYISQQCPWLANSASNRRLLPYVKPTTEWSAISVPVSDNILLPASGEFYYAPSFNTGNYSLGKTQVGNSQGIKGGEGMLMKGTVGTVYRFRRNDAVSNYSVVTPSTNYLKGVTNASSKTLSYSSSGPFYYTFDGQKFNRVNSSATVYSGEAYLQLPSSYSNVYIDSDITTYDLWINGTQVTSDNCDNLKVISGVSGTTVSYNPTSKTLTLSNSTITNSTAGGIRSEISGLTIKVIGTNNVTVTAGNNYALQFMQNATITGTGTLNATTSAGTGCLVYTGKTLTVSGGVKLKITGAIYGILGYSSTSRLIISGASTKLTAKGVSQGSYYQLPTTMNDGLALTSPAGAYFNNGTVIYNGSVAKNIDVVISKPAVTRGDVDGDGNVNITDVTVLIDYLLSGNSSGVSVGAADCDQDGSVNITDVTVLIDYLLSGSW